MYQMQIRIADANNISFLTTGGGHGVSDYSAFEGITIDLGNFKTVELDAERNRLTIGGGTEYSRLHDLLHDAGKELRTLLLLVSILLFSWKRKN